MQRCEVRVTIETPDGNSASKISCQRCELPTGGFIFKGADPKILRELTDFTKKSLRTILISVKDCPITDTSSDDSLPQIQVIKI